MKRTYFEKIAYRIGKNDTLGMLTCLALLFSVFIGTPSIFDIIYGRGSCSFIFLIFPIVMVILAIVFYRIERRSNIRRLIIRVNLCFRNPEKKIIDYTFIKYLNPKDRKTFYKCIDELDDLKPTNGYAEKDTYEKPFVYTAWNLLLKAEERRMIKNA